MKLAGYEATPAEEMKDEKGYSKKEIDFDKLLKMIDACKNPKLLDD
jgi:hypothetical protein